MCFIFFGVGGGVGGGVWDLPIQAYVMYTNNVCVCVRLLVFISANVLDMRRNFVCMLTQNDTDEKNEQAATATATATCEYEISYTEHKTNQKRSSCC